MFVVAGLLVLLALWAGVRLADAQRHLRAAEQAFLEAKSAIAETRTDDAEVALEHAEEKLAAAALHADAFPLDVLRPIPLLGSPTKAVADVADAGAELVAAGRVVNGAAELFPTSGAVAVDGHDLSAFHDAALGAEAALVEAEAHVRAAADIVDGPAGAMLPQLSSPARSLAGTIDDAITQLDGAERGLALLADLTAATTEARILVASQDSMELRATGGFIGSFGVIRFSQGTAVLERYDSYEALPPPDPPMEAPPELARTLNAHWDLSNAGWWPDFPTSAANIAEIFERQGGGQIDGVVAITEYAMARLVGAMGPFQVPGYDEPVVEEGFADRVLYETSLKRPRDEPRKKFTIELSKLVFNRLFDLDSDEVPSVLTAFDESIAARDVQAWFADDARQARVAGTTVAGEMPTTESDFLMLVDSNLTASKANRDLVRDVTYHVRRETDGRIRASLTVRTRNEGEQYDHNPYYNGLLRVYVPAGAQLVEEDIHRRSKGIDPVTGYQILETNVLAEPEGGEHVVNFEYRLPDDVAPESRYHLTWRRQAGTPADTLLVQVGSRQHRVDDELHLETGLRRNRVKEFLDSRALTEWLVD